MPKLLKVPVNLTRLDHSQNRRQHIIYYDYFFKLHIFISLSLIRHVMEVFINRKYEAKPIYNFTLVEKLFVEESCYISYMW